MENNERDDLEKQDITIQWNVFCVLYEKRNSYIKNYQKDDGKVFIENVVEMSRCLCGLVLLWKE